MKLVSDESVNNFFNSGNNPHDLIPLETIEPNSVKGVLEIINSQTIAVVRFQSALHLVIDKQLYEFHSIQTEYSLSRNYETLKIYSNSILQKKIVRPLKLKLTAMSLLVDWWYGEHESNDINNSILKYISELSRSKDRQARVFTGV